MFLNKSNEAHFLCMCMSSDGILSGKIAPACWKSQRKIRNGLKDHSVDCAWWSYDCKVSKTRTKQAYNERLMAEYYKTPESEYCLRRRQKKTTKKHTKTPGSECRVNHKVLRFIKIHDFMALVLMVMVYVLHVSSELHRKAWCMTRYCEFGSRS